MKKYRIKIEDNLPFPDEEKSRQWIQILNNPTSVAALIITIGELEDDKKLTIECYHE